MIMRNFMIVLAILIVGAVAYQMGTPILTEMGIDMNLTAPDNVGAEEE